MAIATKSDYTTIVRDEHGVSILKAKIIDDTYLYFQMYNKTKDILFSCIKIKADFGLLHFLNPNKIEREIELTLSKTKSVNRNRLIMYYKKIELCALVNTYHSN